MQFYKTGINWQGKNRLERENEEPRNTSITKLEN